MSRSIDELEGLTDDRLQEGCFLAVLTVVVAVAIVVAAGCTVLLALRFSAGRAVEFPVHAGETSEPVRFVP